MSFAEPPGAADLCGSAGCFDGSVVDERGLLVAAGKRAAGEQVNTGEAWSCPTSPPRTHCLFLALFLGVVGLQVAINCGFDLKGLKSARHRRGPAVNHVRVSTLIPAIHLN